MNRQTLRTILATALGLTLITSTTLSAALARPGGIKVDTDSSCTDTNREVNEVTAGSVYVWLNIDPDSSLSGYTYKIFSNGTSEKNGTYVGGSLAFEPCGSTAERYAVSDGITVPGTAGSYTLVVYDADGNRVGSDSFRVEVPV